METLETFFLDTNSAGIGNLDDGVEGRIKKMDLGGRFFCRHNCSFLGYHRPERGTKRKKRWHHIKTESRKMQDLWLLWQGEKMAKWFLRILANFGRFFGPLSPQ